MLKIGLTGSIGSGKSLVSEIFSELSVPVYNADTEAKRFFQYPLIKSKIISLFGLDSIDSTAEVNRSHLAGIVFNNEEKLKKLNELIHPLVINDFECWSLLYHSNPYIIHEAAILFESGISSKFDKIITVSAPEELRLQRVIKRDQVNESDVRSRMKNQCSEEEKISKADYVIVNDELQLLIPQIVAVHKQILGILL